MLDYLQKFNELPVELREKISSSEVISAISEIEKKYNINLATLVMRVMVKDIRMVDLSKFMVFEFSMDARIAEDVVGELNSRVFSVVAEYLGIYKEKKEDNLEQEDVHQDIQDISREKLKARSSSFFFSSDDELEVQELAKKVESHKKEIAKAAVRIDPYEKKITAIIETLNISFSSEDLRTRFKNIVSTFLKGVRNRIDVQQTMSKSLDKGGLGLSNDAIEEIMIVIDRVVKKYDQPLIRPVPEIGIKGINEDTKKDIENKDKTKPVPRDQEYDFEALRKKQENKQREMRAPAQTFKNFNYGQEKEDLNHQEIEKKVKKPEFNKTIKKDKPEINHEKKEREEVKKVKEVKKITRRVINVGNQKLVDKNNTISRIKAIKKKTISDVKQMPKLTGPIDELRYMNLTYFRKLSHNPKVAVEKIREKISILEDESYSKRLEGIKAWRKSPLNKKYIQVGQDAISKTGGINATIEEMNDSQEDCLTKQEFEEIMDLNKSLRF